MPNILWLLFNYSGPPSTPKQTLDQKIIGNIPLSIFGLYMEHHESLLDRILIWLIQYPLKFILIYGDVMTWVQLTENEPVC